METQDLYYKSKEFAIDHVQSIVEDSISIFIPTNIGCLNGIVEIIVNEIPLNIRFGVLIYNSSDANVQIIQNEILVNIKDYVEYICDFEMPLILIVVSSELDRNYWIDVKKILSNG